MTAAIWRGEAPLLLASTSSIRRTLLEGAGIAVEARAPGVDERQVERGLQPGLQPVELANTLARAKCEAVAGQHPERVVVGADQVLECQGEVFSKPASRAAAADHLRRLSGRTHRLHSAVALAAGGEVQVFAAEAVLTMRNLEEGAIQTYLAAAGEAATRSVGAYEIERLGIHLFSRVEGEHSTILGLPMIPLLAALRRRGLLAL
jgi:septum formation protein